MDFTTLLATADISDKGATYPLPENWLQGRTAYGGLTAAMLAHEALRQFPDLPLLRTAQVAFVGPASGKVKADADILRRGKSTTFVDARLEGEKGVTTRGSFVFGAARESSLTFADLEPPRVPSVEDMGDAPAGPGFLNFLSQFELMPAVGGLPFSGADSHEVIWWARHREEAARNTRVGLLALGDIAPPAAAMRLNGFAPVSSVNWHTDFLTDDISSDGGWYLLRSRAESSGDGWSSQEMAVWTSDRRPVMAGRQSVAIFA